MPWPAGRHHVTGAEFEIGNVADERPMNLIVDFNLKILCITCDFSNADTFFRSALSSTTACYELRWLCQLLTSQKDAEGGAIIFTFKKAGAYRESAKIPRHTKMIDGKFWHQVPLISSNAWLYILSSVKRHLPPGTHEREV